jgi:hypothetical protein
MNYPNININNYYPNNIYNQQIPTNNPYMYNNPYSHPNMMMPMQQMPYQNQMNGTLYNIELYEDPKKKATNNDNKPQQFVFNTNQIDIPKKSEIVDPFKNLVSFK